MPNRIVMTKDLTVFTVIVLMVAACGSPAVADFCNRTATTNGCPNYVTTQGCGTDGCDYYVSTSGCNTNGGQCHDDAWGTLMYAVEQLSPGDTLCVMPGVYAQGISFDDITTGGLSWDEAITVRAYDPDCRPILRPPATWDLNVLRFSGGDNKYIVVDGLVLVPDQAYFGS